MKLRDAIVVLMQCAQRDVVGSGQGYRATSNEWRDEVSEAWSVAFKKVYHHEPNETDFFNACMSQPNTKEETKT